jgi:hypothetical protein
MKIGIYTMVFDILDGWSSHRVHTQKKFLKKKALVHMHVST